LTISAGVTYEDVCHSGFAKLSLNPGNRVLVTRAVVIPRVL